MGWGDTYPLETSLLDIALIRLKLKCKRLWIHYFNPTVFFYNQRQVIETNSNSPLIRVPTFQPDYIMMPLVEERIQSDFTHTLYSLRLVGCSCSEELLAVHIDVLHLPYYSSYPAIEDGDNKY